METLPVKRMKDTTSFPVCIDINTLLKVQRFWVQRYPITIDNWRLAIFLLKEFNRLCFKQFPMHP
jgi:hypothetical protein